MPLELIDVAKTYVSRNGGAATVAALANVNLRIESGQFVAVQGPSGCGKSTLLLVAGTLLAPDEGEVRLDDTQPYRLSAEERARFRAQRIGFVFQQFHLVPYLNVLDNVLAPSLAIDIPRAKDRARELIDRLGLTPRLRHVPAELSTGERQRVALARAMLAGPQLVLADEPTGNLDRANADGVLDSLREFARGGGCVLMVTHDSQAAARADQVLLMDGGRLEQSQPASA